MWRRTLDLYTNKTKSNIYQKYVTVCTSVEAQIDSKNNSVARSSNCGNKVSYLNNLSLKHPFASLYYLVLKLILSFATRYENLMRFIKGNMIKNDR